MSARLNLVVFFILGILIMIAGLAGAFAWGRWSSVQSGGNASAGSPDFPRAPEIPMIENDQIAIFDQVFELINHRKLAEAEMALKSAMTENPEMPFARYLLAQVYRWQGLLEKADPLFQESVERGEAVVPSLLILAQFKNAQSDLASMSSNLYGEALRYDPLEPEAFFHFGQALRAQGRNLEAVERLRQALLRAQTDTERPVIEVKFALARLEASDEGIVEELQSAEKEEPARAHMLVAAAALALLKDNPTKAAQLLERAQIGMSPQVFRALLADKFFDIGRQKPELASFFAHTPPGSAAATQVTPLDAPPAAQPQIIEENAPPPE